jgi:hypothetical protein
LQQDIVAKGFDATRLESTLRRLIDDGLVIEMDGRVLSLVMTSPPTPPQDFSEFPGGAINRAKYPLAAQQVA